MENTAVNLMKWAETELRRSDIKCARQDAEVLFMDSFNMRREDVYLMKNFRPSTHHLNRFRHYVRLRASRCPLQYILKNTEFMGLSFTLEGGIFIPRPETELLVEKVLEYIKSGSKERVNILEIGTGCGNIAISLTKNVTGCRIIASDISDKALKVAARNARFHGVKEDIIFIESDLFENLPGIYYNYFDVIIANPPYVRKRDLGDLEPEISHEDVMAIDGGEDGLYFYRRILNEGVRYLKKSGIFALEIGYDQAEDIASLIKNDGRFSEINFIRDYSGHNRVVIFRV